MKQRFQRCYYVLFAYDTDTDYTNKYAIITASCLEAAYRKAIKHYGTWIVRDVITEYIFEKKMYRKLYGFTLKEDLTRKKA